jgi:hypothetical protein
MVVKPANKSARLALVGLMVSLMALSPWQTFRQPANAMAQNLRVSRPRVRAVGSMNTARTGAASCTLSNGAVLVTGGIDANFNYLASAELYNPTIQRFSPLPPMTAARAGHTATLLPNGQVLIAGGVDCTGGVCRQLSSAEIYDPTVRRFFAIGNMMVARTSHTATLLANGTVLLAGGFNGSAISSAEIYNPPTGQFIETATMLSPRFLHTATLLPNGEVFIAGGRSCDGDCLTDTASHTAEVYDAGRRQFFAAGTMTESRSLHTASLLPDGRVLIAGGTACSGDCEGSATLPGASIYDPATGKFSAAGDMATPRAGQQSIALPDGNVFLYGGIDCSGPTGCQFLDNGDIFQPDSLNFTPAGSGTVGGFDLIVALLANQQVLVAGGSTGRSVFRSANLFSFQPNWPFCRRIEKAAASVLPPSRGVIAPQRCDDLVSGCWCPKPGPMSDQSDSDDEGNDSVALACYWTRRTARFGEIGDDALARVRCGFSGLVIARSRNSVPPAVTFYSADWL